MKYIIFLLLLSGSFSSTGQGFNNDQEFDKEDLMVLFAHNKLIPFKFYFTAPDDSSCNIIVEQYLDGQLVRTENFYESTKNILSFSDEPFEYYYPPLNGTSKPIARLYFDENQKDSLILSVQTKHIGIEFVFPRPSGLRTGARAYDPIPDQLRKRERLVLFYGNEGAWLSCPGNTTAAKASKDYKLVIAVYAEPFRPE